MSKPSATVRRRSFAASALCTVTAFTALAFVGSASASPKDEPTTDDPRAVVHADNVTTCAAAGLPGETYQPSQIQHEVDESNTYIDVKADVADGTITAIVVKGGPAYNVYLASALGGFPALDLRPPLVSSGKPAQISHWFACVEKTGQTTTPSGTNTEPKTEPTTGGDAATPTTTEAPGETTTAPASSTTTTAAPVSGTTTSAVAAVAADKDNDDLASTGFGSAWLIYLGMALVAAGAVFVASPKLRGLIRR
jgi:hypothetical protein